MPRHAFEAAVNRLQDDDLPVFAMLLDREPIDVIAATLGIDRGEVSWRVQRIIGKLRPKLRSEPDEHFAGRTPPARS